MCCMLPIWLVLLSCLPLQGSEVRVHQPPELRASLGGSVLLNCTFSAAPKASKLAVTWVRSAPGGSGEVQIYPPHHQVTELRSRVALDSGRFRHQRDASLHLANLTQHDAGLYRCFIWTSATSSHAGNGTELSVLGERPGSGVQRWAACGPLGVLAPILLVLHAMVCRECQGLRHRRRHMRSGAQGQAGDPQSRPTLGLAGKDGAPRPL
ncbi:natural cytotoxicity triggering receptor 3-like [Chrysemys picta bellii]|uniref:natural cytotoxicity triggering receptor 3-like n=1 Tax=Chrysemys picta bellii TaxID=8478 RepID=UPI0032B288C9